MDVQSLTKVDTSCGFETILRHQNFIGFVAACIRCSQSLTHSARHTCTETHIIFLREFTTYGIVTVSAHKTILTTMTRALYVCAINNLSWILFALITRWHRKSIEFLTSTM